MGSILHCVVSCQLSRWIYLSDWLSKVEVLGKSGPCVSCHLTGYAELIHLAHWECVTRRIKTCKGSWSLSSELGHHYFFDILSPKWVTRPPQIQRITNFIFWMWGATHSTENWEENNCYCFSFFAVFTIFGNLIVDLLYINMKYKPFFHTHGFLFM